MISMFPFKSLKKSTKQGQELLVIFLRLGEKKAINPSITLTFSELLTTGEPVGSDFLHSHCYHSCSHSHLIYSHDHFFFLRCQDFSMAHQSLHTRCAKYYLPQSHSKFGLDRNTCRYRYICPSQRNEAKKYL